ncbi:MAG TPA: HEPN domain-containing protein, partial [Chloroflexota bacterium]|nr:HEPN domain-containing protein [Chloroflexota bacterium]
MSDLSDIYLHKAEQSLAGAESELANGRYNNCANRCYYACFQAAIAALIEENLRPGGEHSEWSHRFVQASFAGELIRRRKRYPASMRDSLSELLVLR